MAEPDYRIFPFKDMTIVADCTINLSTCGYALKDNKVIGSMYLCGEPPAPFDKLKKLIPPEAHHRFFDVEFPDGRKIAFEKLDVPIALGMFVAVSRELIEHIENEGHDSGVEAISKELWEKHQLPGEYRHGNLHEKNDEMLKILVDMLKEKQNYWRKISEANLQKLLQEKREL